MLSKTEPTTHSRQYPEIRPFARHTLAVSSRHTLYIEECGNPKGLPVLVIHGGPGGGCDTQLRRYFNPAIYRIVLYDQRGAGRSSPRADLVDNTTDHLLADMERIRQLLGIPQLTLFGGSWGATLALLYAQAHPDRVLGLVLRNIFLCRPEDIRWYYQDGARHLFPDHWMEFANYIPEDERGNLVQAYYRRLTDADSAVRQEAANFWVNWEAHTSTLAPKPDYVNELLQPQTALTLARLEAHYFAHNGFVKPNQILDCVHRIAHLPAVLVHGRYDVVCPLHGAWALNKAWPGAKLEVVDFAAHAANDPRTVNTLVDACDQMALRLSSRSSPE